MATSPPRHRRALVVRGGWLGHQPRRVTDHFVPALRHNGFDVQLSDTLEVYEDADVMSRADLVVHCWSMGTMTSGQLQGISAAVAAGTGLVGWHGGVLDSFRDEFTWHLMVGGQFVHHHAGDFVRYRVDIEVTDPVHPVIDGIDGFELVSEQYYLHVDPGNEVLATTRYVDDPDVPGLDGRIVPVVWTRRWGAGRVFVTSIGHRLEDLAVPQVDTLLTRGMVWASR